MLIHTRKWPASLRLRSQELPIPNRRPQRQSHLIIFIRIRISALKLAKFHRGAVFARECDAEVFFAETGAERVEGLHVVAKIVRTRGHAGAHDTDINFDSAWEDCDLALVLVEEKL